MKILRAITIATVCLASLTWVFWPLIEKGSPQPPSWLKPVGERGIQQTLSFVRTNDLYRVIDLANNPPTNVQGTTVIFPARVFHLYRPIVLTGSNLTLSLSGSTFFSHECAAMELKGAENIHVHGGIFDASLSTNHNYVLGVFTSGGTISNCVIKDGLHFGTEKP